MKRRELMILAAGAAFICAMLLMPLPVVTTSAGATVEIDWRGRGALGILGFTALLWATEAFPLAVTGLIGCALLPVLGAAQWEDVIKAGLSSDIMPFLLGTMITSYGIKNSGLADRLALVFARRVGQDPRRVIFAFLMLGCVLSMVIGNLTAAAVVVPIALSFLQANDVWPGKSNFGKGLMIACAWGPIIGSIGTPVGSSSSVITMEFLRELADVHITFAQWAAVGIPSALLIIVPAWLILLTLFPVKDEPVRTRALDRNPVEVRPLSREEWSVIISVLVMWSIWIGSNTIEQVTGMRMTMSFGAVIGALIYITTRSTRVVWEDIERSTSLTMFITIAAGLSLGSAIHRSSAGPWLANALFSGILHMPVFPRAFLTAAIVCILKMFFSSNTATASIIVPILISLVGHESGLAMWKFIAPAGMASSLALVLVTSSPTSFIAYKSGYFSISDMAKAGALLAIAASLSVALVTASVMLKVV